MHEEEVARLAVLVHMSIRGNIIVLFNAYMLFGVQLL
jgi:hypothetical protein